MSDKTKINCKRSCTRCVVQFYVLHASLQQVLKSLQQMYHCQTVLSPAWITVNFLTLSDNARSNEYWPKVTSCTSVAMTANQQCLQRSLLQKKMHVAKHRPTDINTQNGNIASTHININQTPNTGKSHISYVAFSSSPSSHILAYYNFGHQTKTVVPDCF